MLINRNECYEEKEQDTDTKNSGFLACWEVIPGMKAAAQSGTTIPSPLCI